MPWQDQTLPHSSIVGKNRTDAVNRLPKTPNILPDPIPAETDMLQEAKALIEAKATAYNPGYIVAQGGPTAFLTAALANSQVSRYFVDLLGWAWLYFWNSSMFSEEGDRFYVQRQQAMNMIDTLLGSAMEVAVSSIGTPTVGNARVRARVSSFDAHGPYNE